MPYRRTRKYEAQRRRQEAARRTRDADRMAGPAPEYPRALPELRMRITVERFDFGPERHVFELRRSTRCDQYEVSVDGEPWATAGLARVLEGLRKALPRVMSARALG